MLVKYLGWKNNLTLDLNYLTKSYIFEKHGSIVEMSTNDAKNLIKKNPYSYAIANKIELEVIQGIKSENVESVNEILEKDNTLKNLSATKLKTYIRKNYKVVIPKDATKDVLYDIINEQKTAQIASELI